MTDCMTNCTADNPAPTSDLPPADRDALIEQYLPLATRTARSLWRRRRWLDLEDLIGQAQLALVKVVRGMDLSRLTRFTLEEYLHWRIKVKLKDYIRVQLGRGGERVPIVRAMSLDDGSDGEPGLGRIIEDWRGALCHEGPPRDVVQKLVENILPMNCKVAIRCMLLACRDGEDERGAGVMLMDKIGKSESRASQVKKKAIQMLRQLGERRVREILFGRGE